MGKNLITNKSNKMADEKEEKEFTFMVQRAGNEVPEKVVKKESELDRFEKEYLYNNLLSAFVNNTAENQEKFLQYISDIAQEIDTTSPPTSEA